MADMNVTMDDIEILRDKLSSLIQAKGELLDPEVIQASILLDNALNDYNGYGKNGSGVNRIYKIC